MVDQDTARGGPPRSDGGKTAHPDADADADAGAGDRRAGDGSGGDAVPADMGGATGAGVWTPAEPVNFEPRRFHPAPWLPGAHAQTIGGRFLRPVPALELRRERIHTPDGDFLDLDVPGAALAADAPVVLVLHGLEGHARARYMLSAYGALIERGLRPVGLNFRSCSGEINRATRFYHSGETGDLRLVLADLSERFPADRYGLLGFSLGGNVLLKHLGEAGAGAEPVKAAAAVSVPFDLAAGADRLRCDAMGRIYTEYFLRTLRRKVRAKGASLAGRCDAAAALAADSLRAFDDAVTAPLHGFRDADEYYSRCSSGRFLERIRVPTLLLQSADDPFLPDDAIPTDVMDSNPWLVGRITRRGGHVGFLSGPPWAPRPWAEVEAARFLARVLRPGYTGRKKNASPRIT